MGTSVQNVEFPLVQMRDKICSGRLSIHGQLLSELHLTALSQECRQHYGRIIKELQEDVDASDTLEPESNMTEPS